jgi:endoglucanase
MNVYESYLKFDVSSVPNGAAVFLKLYGQIDNNSAQNVPVALYPVANVSWNEQTITWRNKPAASGGALSTIQVLDTTPRFYYWDVTSYVQSEKAAGRNVISLVLKSLVTTSPYLFFSSKEASSNKPQLVSSGAGATAVAAQISPFATTRWWVLRNSLIGSF